MKTKIRVLAFLLVVAMLVTVMPFATITSFALESTGYSKMDSFINDSRFTSGVSWNSDQTPKLSPNKQWWGCAAYCTDYVYYCYGYQYASAGQAFSNINEIRAGDVLTIGLSGDGTPHWFVCLKRNGNRLYVAEGNWNWSVVRIGWNYTIKNSSHFNERSESWSGGYHYLPDTHTCNQNGGFAYYWAAHPHYNCYYCSICGKVTIKTSETNFVVDCDICQNSLIPTLVKSIVFNNHTYSLYSCKNIKWETAKTWCENDGGHLATITSPEENSAILDLVGDNYKIWLGANDIEQEGNWKWVTGEPFVFSDWGTGEPSNTGTLGENYLNLHIDNSYQSSRPYWNDSAGVSDWFVFEESYTATPTPSPAPTSTPLPGYSDWTDELPEGVNSTNYDIDTKTVYSSRTKENRTANTSTLAGWERASSDYSLVNERSATLYYANFPNSTSDYYKFNVLDDNYAKYNITKLSAVNNDSSLRVINSDVHYTYLYWQWCYDTDSGGNYVGHGDSKTNRAIGAYKGEVARPNLGPCNNWSCFVEDEDYPEDLGAYDCYDVNDSTSGSRWYLRTEVFKQSYTEWDKEYTFYRWSEYSDWQDEPIASTDSIEVQTKTLYSYKAKPEVTSGHTAEPTSAPIPVYMTIVHKPNKIAFYIGEKFDPTGLQVRVAFSDGTAQVFGVDGITYDAPDNTLNGVQSVPIHYGNLTKNIAVRFNGRSDVRKITLAKKPTKLIYKQGERFDGTGMIVNALASDNTVVETLTSDDYRVAGFTTVGKDAGIYQCIIAYMEYYQTGCSYRVTNEKVVASYVVSKPSKLIYKTGEAFDKSGMNPYVKYYDNTTAPIDVNSLVISGFDNTTAGVQSINVYYQGVLVKTFSIRVNA